MDFSYRPMDFDKLFEDSNSEDYASKLLRKYEKEQIDKSEALKDREKDREAFKKRLKFLQRELNSIKNVKNHRATEINKKNHQVREKVKKEIEELKDKLYRIKMEEEGSTKDISVNGDKEKSKTGVKNILKADSLDFE